MVPISTITERNSQYAGRLHSGKVLVFAGATQGIGLGTLRKMVTMLQSSTFYVLGRSESKFATEMKQLRTAAPTCKIIFVTTQVSLIASIDTTSEKIMAAENKIDFLCMSPGGMPFQGAKYTDEGLELCFTLSYYARLRLVSNLLPLLLNAPGPRVLSILNGTLEKRINEEDLGLEKNWGITAVVSQTTICTSLAFDYLSANDNQKRVTFIHATPGFVNTGTPRTEYPSTKDGYLWWAFISLMQIVSGWIIVHFGFSLAESGERHAYHLTSDTYQPGSLRSDRFNEVQPANAALQYYQERGWTEKIWDHTQRVWEKALIKSSS